MGLSAGLIRTPLQSALIVTLLTAVAIWVPLRMQDIMIPHNEACFGPFTDADIRALLTIRYQTWAVSLITTGLCIAAICWLTPNRRFRLLVIAVFVIWKGATFYYDSVGSPICWEPYANDTPFWDEPAGTGLALIAQPLSFLCLAVLLIGNAGVKWGMLLRSALKNRSNRGN